MRHMECVRRWKARHDRLALVVLVTLYRAFGYPVDVQFHCTPPYMKNLAARRTSHSYRPRVLHGASPGSKVQSIAKR